MRPKNSYSSSAWGTMRSAEGFGYSRLSSVARKRPLSGLKPVCRGRQAEAISAGESNLSGLHTMADSDQAACNEVWPSG